MPKIVELRQNRSYIKTNFDGYKLSLDAVPILKTELSVPPLQALPTQNQYSFLHLELFSTQNLLYVDPWERNDAYFINVRNEVVRARYNENTGRSEPLQIVLSLNSEERLPGDYNFSLRFVSEKYCVVCNGSKSLILIETADRRKANSWTVLEQIDLSSMADLKERQYTLLDARLDIINERKQVSLAVAHIDKVEALESSESATQHFMLVYWLQWTYAETKWELKVLQTLRSKGSLFYCDFENRAESLILGSNRGFQFYDKNETPTEIERESTVRPKLHDAETFEDFNNMSWQQTNDDVVIKFHTPKKLQKGAFKVKCTVNQLKVEIESKTVLERELYAEVDADLITWSIQENSLEVTLIKRQTSLTWPCLLSDGTGPTEDTADNTTKPAEQQPIVNLEAPIEDCDFPLALEENDNKIERFNLLEKNITHSILLGTHAPLFSTILRPGYPKAFAVRQDVDASLYLQQYNPNKPEEWDCRHEGNLHAFGYVLASKQQKKFVDCAPDLSFVIVCEAARHIFLYILKNDSANGLRNRNGPQVTLGKQHLITLPESDEVLGLTTACNTATLLTSKSVMVLQINCENQ